MTTLYPIRDRIVVCRDEEMKRTEFGLFIPDTSTEKPDRGVVIAVGPGKLNAAGDTITMEVTEGDTVIFARNAGYPVKIDGKELIIMREEDLLARVS